jgi:acyl carrier protein
MNEQMIGEKVKRLLAEVLGLDESDITMDSNLIDDLAAESIDFIDLTFRLEKDFNLGKVSIADIIPQYLREESSYNENKLLKDEKIDELKKYPHITGELFDEIKITKSFGTLLKVQNLVNFVSSRQENI